MKKIVFFGIVMTLVLNGCSNTKYLTNYTAINTYLASLEKNKFDKNKIYFLQKEKILNKYTLSIFNGESGIDHPVDTLDPMLPFYKDVPFIEKDWEIMYNTYINDTKTRYWNKNEITLKNIKIRSKKEIYSPNPYDDLLKEKIIYISEPIYYMKRKYIMFYCTIEMPINGGGPGYVVVMKKEKGKWIVVQVFSSSVIS